MSRMGYGPVELISTFESESKSGRNVTLLRTRDCWCDSRLIDFVPGLRADRFHSALPIQFNNWLDMSHAHQFHRADCFDNFAISNDGHAHVCIWPYAVWINVKRIRCENCVQIIIIAWKLLRWIRSREQRRGTHIRRSHTCSMRNLLASVSLARFNYFISCQTEVRL